MSRQRTGYLDLSSDLKRIRAKLPGAMLRDQASVNRKLEALAKRKPRDLSPGEFRRLLDAFEHRLDSSVKIRRERIRRKPPVTFPENLPITSHKEKIIKAIVNNQVVILSGETGCGKSTQIPKMCLEAGRGIFGKIGCTQPRRIAATTIARRIAEELKENLGRSVGYKIRFRDTTSPDVFIKILTDGMLLSETQSDPRLYDYDTLIIDEAHERSLNIDFLLGIARSLLPQRPELKLIITSATLDTEKFSRAFENAPVIHVGGRMFPVEVKYMPLEASAEARDVTYIDLAVKAVDRLKKGGSDGDILIFMPTEQDILETCERLEGRKYAGTTVLPLYARLPGTKQGRVYSVMGSKIVVATNVAETSLTIPGIKYVIDTGLARISQYLPETRTSSLPISPISRSSADQRKGRCGRVRKGICIRLFAESDYDSRLLFTPPEILRSNLAEVILRMVYLKLGHPASFPFIDRPNSKHIKDGYETLVELGALKKNGREYSLTGRGRIMARMPLDPKISRILLESGKEDCLEQVAVIASALSIRDPRERPADKAGDADQMHAPFKHPESDFLSLLNIWNRYHSDWEKLDSQNKRKKFCREHYLSFPRMREWIYIHDQILTILKELKIIPPKKQGRVAAGALYSGIHRSILSGYLSNIAAKKEKNIYHAPKNREVMVFPGSTLFNRGVSWIVAAEMVKTSRLFARTAAKIDPAWLEDLGGDLCRRSYSNPHWDPDRGEVRAKERVTLYGLEIVSDRSVSYGRINPEEAHDIFVRLGLVEGNIPDPPGFLRHNLKLLQQFTRMEEKVRRRDLLVGEDVLAEFYSARLGEVSDFRTLRKRLRKSGGDDFLRMSEQEMLRGRPDYSEIEMYPDEMELAGFRLKTSYKFSPGDIDDGVTLKVPLSLIAKIPEESVEWGVPGQIGDKISALVKGLPKRYRKQLVPVAEKVEIIRREMEPGDRSLFNALAEFVRKRFRVDIPASEWARVEIPPHLKMRVALVDSQGNELEAGRELRVLKQSKAVEKAGGEDSPAWKKLRADWEKSGLTSWDFGPLPESLHIGPFAVAYPALVPGDQGVNLRLFESRNKAADAHKAGIRALLLLRFAKDIKFIRRTLKLSPETSRAALFFGGGEEIVKGMESNLLRELLQKNLRNREEFETYAEKLGRELFEKGHILRKTTEEILEAYRQTRTFVSEIKKQRAGSSVIVSFCEKILSELDRLLPGDFLERYSLNRLVHLSRYLETLRLRTERALIHPEKDRQKEAQVRQFIDFLLCQRQTPAAQTTTEKQKALDELFWMIEEFKVTLFAPELKTAGPVSLQRLARKCKQIKEMI